MSQKDLLASLHAMTPAQRASALEAMSPTEKQAMLAALSPEERLQALRAFKVQPSPSRPPNALERLKRAFLWCFLTFLLETVE